MDNQDNNGFIEIIPDYIEAFNEILPNKLHTELIDIIKDYTFNFEDILNYHDLVLCHDCGNIWDGNAQCNCWEYYGFDADFNEAYYEQFNNSLFNEESIIN